MFDKFVFEQEVKWPLPILLAVVLLTAIAGAGIVIRMGYDTGQPDAELCVGYDRPAFSPHADYEKHQCL